MGINIPVTIVTGFPSVVTIVLSKRSVEVLLYVTESSKCVE